VASVGAPDPFDHARHGALDMTRAVRSPGSALKPLIYGMALEAGLIHPETLIEDAPVDFGGWTPRNFDRGFQGAVTVRAALEQSLNVPAVAVLQALGPAALAARMRAAGAPPRLPSGAAPGLPMALGGVGVTLAELTGLYAAIARGAALQPRAAWQVGDILSRQPPPPGAPRLTVAWKTGTSYGHRDAWALGFDGRHAVGVWVGRADGAAIPGVMGAEVAAPLLFAAFQRLGPPTPLPPRPHDLPALAHADLPPSLRRFGAAPAGPRIAFPPDGARVDLGLAAGAPAPLALRVAEGVAPFTWLVDGRPLPADPWDRAAFWEGAGPGFAEIAVIDATGAAARAQVFVE
jgi:penicillin-binding protein 1C